MADTITHYYNDDIREDYGPVNTEHDMLENFRDYLDDVYGTISVAGYELDTSRVLEEVDPIAFRQDFLAYADTWEEIEVPFDIAWGDTDTLRSYIVGEIDR